MSSPAPKSPEQSEKSKKYDRQLRLWGDHGQRLLENSKVCLINATALGTETLKSLVLPGIGAFTIVDAEKITEEDIGSNFFLESDSVGLSRAQVATRVLLELNPDVRGDYINESAEQILSNQPDFFNSFTVVIATAVPEKILIPLSRCLWEQDIPLLVCRSIGFIAYLRVQVKEHTVIETHPDNETPDLQLDNPWNALKTHLDNIHIESLDSKERSHVPALVILYYYLQKFKGKHMGSLPKTRQEKEELRNLIRSGLPVDEHGIKSQEENFDEAVHFVNMCIGPTQVLRNIRNLLDDDRCINLTQQSSPFWVIARAVREFVETTGSLPLRGSIPDMAADTASYIALQQLYQRQAQSQSESIFRRACQLAQGLGRSSDSITETEVKLFCKHASELHVARGTCIADEYASGSLDIASALEDPDSLTLVYAMLRGLERFISESNRYPGEYDELVEPDVLKLKGSIGKLLAEWGAAPLLKDERVHEMCRYGGAELHSVSAMLGGCVAHEAIKLITHQYKPLDNTFIYDAITSNSATFQF